MAERVAEVIREVAPQSVVTHWRRSGHPDHRNTAQLAERARTMAHPDLPLFHAENREDAEGFTPDRYLPVSEKYIDYYTELMTKHGRASGSERACALAVP
ncbi:PIG-L deacetylase family protein [Streptomyces coryli]|uniref:PIG-L deacetylase family protein n=1 Tax=Streptomyces coryli TaxID=1128680 RepID=UPI001F0E57D1|nr:PIG-L family deacetylase [Streptomyces coryli]